MFRGDYESGGDAVSMRSNDLTFEKRLGKPYEKHGTRNCYLLT